MGIINKLIEGGIKGIADGAASVINAINAPKEEKEKAILEVEKLRIQHEETMAAQANDLEKAYLDSIKSAQEMNVKIQESASGSWMAKNIAYLIDIFVCIVWGALTIYISAIWLKVIESKADMTGILSLYATVTAVFMTILNFHRGTSRGSERKQETLDAVMKNSA